MPGRLAASLLLRAGWLAVCCCCAANAGKLADSLGVRLQLLLTCRKTIGIPNEHPLTLTVKELGAHEAQELLRSMAQVPESHAAIIAELCGGMPLALRLCGCAIGHGRVRVSAEQLIERLQAETAPRSCRDHTRSHQSCA